ncbi:Methyltransferase FkbM [Reticulomyxa filosa]|uniref:Methyltransferase FkbM n=1 Tax=Reticulomyxa filosa TaxID=46433 RepID=X6MIA6_RETFI|nr:Methyltransferase FkbM [Reticulomyxa filosa]|eukprot:ETO12795.1 Methyltransferase FkbM [Reticulomyxa filosa]
MRLRREENRTKKTRNGFLVLLILVVLCYFLMLLLDYGISTLGLNKVSDETNAKRNGEMFGDASKGTKDQDRSTYLQQKFRYEYGEMIRSKLETRDVKLPSDMETLSLLSDVYTRENEGINFIQVGACDGNFLASNDPVQRLLQNSHWHGVLMEPVPFLFEKLQANVESSMASAKQRLYLMNAALSSANGPQAFYVVNDEFAKEKPEETHALKYQIGSFNKNHIVKHLSKLQRRNELQFDVDHYIDTVTVRGVTPDTVVHEFKQSNLAVRDGTIDVLLIDAEGYDFIVLKSFMNIAHLRPPVIIYENLHLSANDKQQAQDLLVANGYTVWTVRWNSIGVKIADI